MIKKLSFMTVLASAIWCGLAWTNGDPVSWPIVFLGLIPAVLNLGYDCYEQWHKQVICDLLEEYGLMDELEERASTMAKEIETQIHREQLRDNEEDDD